MAIDFRSIVTDPKIQIIGDEVPVTAFEKASDLLNQRYAQSAEAATRAQEALNQQLQVSDALEKPELKSYYENVYGQLKDIATNDDYLDQEWKTKSLGLRTAANLKVAEERAKIAAQHREQLRLAKGITNPLKRKMYEDEYNKQFAQTKYDPNTGLISFGTLNAPRIVEDVSIPQELNKALAGFASEKSGVSWDNIKIIQKGENIPGTNIQATGPLAYDLKGRQVIEKVKEEDLKRAAKDFITSDPGINSYLQSEVDFVKSQNPELTDSQALSIVNKKYVEPATAFIVNKLGHTDKVIETDNSLNTGLTTVLNTSAAPSNPFFNLPWQAAFNDINTEQLVQPDMKEKTEIASTYFDKNGNTIASSNKLTGKDLDNVVMDLMKKDPVKYPTYDKALKEVSKFNNVKTINDLVPDWQVARIKANNPKLTDKQVYETFMDEKINSKKQLSASYVLADPGLRTALNSNSKALIQTMPIYKLEDGEVKEVTGEEREKALKEPVVFVPGTGQVKLGNGYVTGLGVLKPGEQVQDLNPTQTMMAMASEMISAALDPTVSNATTGNRTFNIPNANGQQTPVRLRILKSGVGKPITNPKTGQRMLYPTTIEVVDQITGKPIGNFNVENNQGIAGFTNFMLNNAAGAYTLE
jgi:hypothetical protein